MTAPRRVTGLGFLAVALLAANAAPSRCEEACNVSVETMSRVGSIKMAPAKIARAKANAPTVTQSIVINASPKFVFEAIQHARKADARKLLSYDGSDATIEEKFMTLPVVGAATCTYVEHEIPNLEGIEYHLVNSDRFTVFQGKWSLTPARDGKSTIVELSSAMDPGIRIPFWQEITKMAACKSVKRRLDEVNGYAMALQSGELTKDHIYTR